MKKRHVPDHVTCVVVCQKSNLTLNEKVDRLM